MGSQMTKAFTKKAWRLCSDMPPQRMRTGATAELVSPDLAPVCAPRGASLVEMSCVGFDKVLLIFRNIVDGEN